MTAGGAAGFPGAVQAVIQRAAHVTRLRYYPVVGSTNVEALTLARAGTPHGTLVLADKQTTGHGRHGRVWYSPGGLGLWFSLVLRPRLPMNRVFWVTAAGALAVADAAGRASGVRAEIRWPNDVLSRGRKIAGLLAEVGGTADRVDFVVLGVGINVNQRLQDFPAGIAREASSLRLLGGRSVDRAELLGLFLAAFERHYDGLEADGGRRVRQAWLQDSAVPGRRVSVRGPGGDFTGLATGLADDGALIVERDGVGRVEVHAADVRLLRELE